MMISRLKSILVVSLTLVMVLATQPTQAEKVQDLYTATWPVASQSGAERSRAIAESFKQALIRVSGTRDVSRSPVVQNAIANASDYLRRYSYQRLSAAEQMIFEKPLLLKATFDKQSLLSVLKSASLPIWGEDRPSGVYWIAFDNGQERQITSEDTEFVAAGLTISAGARGLPVTLPLMDIDDKSAIEFSDVWAKSSTALRNASARYATDYWVAGKLSKEGDQWQASWLVDMKGRTQSFTSTGLTSYEAIQAAVNRVADSLSSKLAVVLSEHAQEVMISVENIQDFTSFAKVQKYLNSLGMVRSASAIVVSQDRVLFKVESLTSPQNLIEAIKLGNNLQRSQRSSVYDTGYGTDYESGSDRGFSDGFKEPLEGDFHFIWGTR